jgi:hypothetical protein
MKKEFIENVSNIKIIGTQLILGLLFFVVIFIALYGEENGDMNVVIFGTLLYLPFILLLCTYNALIIGLFEKLNKKVRILNYILPSFPLVIWFLTSDNVITIRYWELRTSEFLIALTLILATNVTGYYLFKNGDREPASR